MLPISWLVSILLYKLFGYSNVFITDILFILGLCWPLVRRVKWKEYCRAIGLHKGKGVVREVLIGVVGYVAGLPIILGGFLVTILLVKWVGIHSEHPLPDMMANSDTWGMVKIYLLAVVGAPILEESIFRGAFYSYLRTRWGFFVSAIFVAFVFAAIHPQGLIGLPVLMAIAMVLAGLREWRGTLLPSMTAHAVNNGLAVTLWVLLF